MNIICKVEVKVIYKFRADKQKLKHKKNSSKYRTPFFHLYKYTTRAKDLYTNNLNASTTITQNWMPSQWTTSHNHFRFSRNKKQEKKQSIDEHTLNSINRILRKMKRWRKKNQRNQWVFIKFTVPIYVLSSLSMGFFFDEKKTDIIFNAFKIWNKFLGEIKM